MKLSTKGRYGARAMLELALHYGEGPILLKNIAARQDISVRYLEHIMTMLISGGLVNSTRGRVGGFSLAKAPSEITLCEVVELVEGSIAPTSCVDDDKLCPRSDKCITRDIWVNMKKAMMGSICTITLADMVEMHHKKSNQTSPNIYHI
ncbi:MAG: Rrf2 family transcriptional regulator [Nitrospinota bacterium]|nr:Rrf2 family transcriptional regulator [Nitrospinota bacterium]